MNNFTKEELIDISVVLLQWIKNFPGDKELNTTYDKLKSMIDNYCELKMPTMANYCCKSCNEEWVKCECKK